LSFLRKQESGFSSVILVPALRTKPEHATRETIDIVLYALSPARTAGRVGFSPPMRSCHWESTVADEVICIDI
jgi:hypothetical protein